MSRGSDSHLLRVEVGQLARPALSTSSACTLFHGAQKEHAFVVYTNLQNGRASNCLSTCKSSFWQSGRKVVSHKTFPLEWMSSSYDLKMFLVFSVLKDPAEVSFS